MADIVRRRSWGGVLPLGRQASISGSSLIQSVSVSMAPPHPGWANCYPGAEVQGRTGPSPRAVIPLEANAVLGSPASCCQFAIGAARKIDKGAALQDVAAPRWP